ncbi:unnamed protein product [Parajaminaea phylloscopi]
MRIADLVDTKRAAVATHDSGTALTPTVDPDPAPAPAHSHARAGGQSQARRPSRQAGRAAAQSLRHAGDDDDDDDEHQDQEEVAEAAHDDAEYAPLRIASKVGGPSTKSGATAEADPPKRKSRVLRRKTDHSVIERRRREKINERLVRLQDVVPACRDEVFDILERKPIKGGGAAGTRNAAKLTPQQRQQAMEKRCREEMILEKLCIISHTVDYVMELREQVAAYRKLCQCDPPLTLVQTRRDPEMHAKFAHEHDAFDETGSGSSGNGRCPSETNSATSEGAEGPAALAKGEEQQQPLSVEPLLREPSVVLAHDDKLAVSPAALPCVSKAAPAVKRKRHWGSNRPPRPSPPPKRAKTGPQAKTQAQARASPVAPTDTLPCTEQAIVGAPDEEDDGIEDSDDDGDDETTAKVHGPKTAHTTDCADGLKGTTAKPFVRRRTSDPAAHYRHHYPLPAPLRQQHHHTEYEWAQQTLKSRGPSSSHSLYSSPSHPLPPWLLATRGSSTLSTSGQVSQQRATTEDQHPPTSTLPSSLFVRYPGSVAHPQVLSLDAFRLKPTPPHGSSSSSSNSSGRACAGQVPSSYRLASQSTTTTTSAAAATMTTTTNGMTAAKSTSPDRTGQHEHAVAAPPPPPPPPATDRLALLASVSGVHEANSMAPSAAAAALDRSVQ